MTPLVFLDLETTGLTPGLDDVWEAAWVVRDSDGTETENHTFVTHDANKALHLPPAFRRAWAARFTVKEAISSDILVDRLVSTIPAGAHLVGACPWFDQDFLRLHFAGGGFGRSAKRFPWHSHLIDVEALAVGYLTGSDAAAGSGVTFPTEPPWSSDELSAALGVDPGRFIRHSALGDVHWAVAMYDAIMTKEITHV